MKTQIRRMFSFVGAAAITLVFMANGLAGVTDWTGATDNDWNTASNWSNGIPDPADYARFANGGTAILTGPASFAPTDLSMGDPAGGNPFGIVDIQTNGSLTLTGGDANIGVRPSANTSILTVTGGLLSVSNSLILGDEVGSKGAVGINGGTISVNNLRMGVNGEATFVIQGSAPVINVANNLTVKENSPSSTFFNVEIDAGGISPINVTGNTLLDNNPILGVSLNALAPQTDLVLINTGTLSAGSVFYQLAQGDPVSATFGLTTYNWTIDYDYLDGADVALVFVSVETVPEPSTAILGALGLFALGCVARRSHQAIGS